MEGYADRIGRLVRTTGPSVLGLAVFVGSYVARPAYGLVDLTLDPSTPAPDPASPAAKDVVVNSVTPGKDVVILVVAAVSALVVATARRHRWPLYAVAFGGWLLFATWPAIAAASYYTATATRQRTNLSREREHRPPASTGLIAYTATASLLVLLPCVYTAISADDGAGYLLVGFGLVAIAVALPVMAGLWVQARRDIRGGAREWAAGRERLQAALVEQARAQERARIAREMHDVVAHRVSLMVLQAGALEVNAADRRTADTAGLIRGTGREALADLRDVLGVLRSPDAGREPQPMLADLDDLLDQSRSLGTPVERRDEGEPRPLPVAVQRAAYRVVQEALTNVRKHAGNAPTDVVVRYLPDALEIEVHNARPRDAIDPIPGSGLGLAGLRERAGLLGGWFEVRPRPDGGFTICAFLPTGPAEHSA